MVPYAPYAPYAQHPTTNPNHNLKERCMNVATNKAPEITPELTDLQREIERMIEDGAKASGVAPDAIGRDPEAFIAHAAKMLSLARSRRIRAEALYQARRANDIEAFNERLLRLDQDHAKLIRNLSAIITKLEALRS